MHADRFGFWDLKSVLVSPLLNAIEQQTSDSGGDTLQFIYDRYWVWTRRPGGRTARRCRAASFLRQPAPLALTAARSSSSTASGCNEAESTESHTKSAFIRRRPPVGKSFVRLVLGVSWVHHRCNATQLNLTQLAVGRHVLLTYNSNQVNVTNMCANSKESQPSWNKLWVNHRYELKYNLYKQPWRHE